MGNDKAGNYVVGDDFSYNFVYNILTPQAGITFAQTTKAGNLGYIVEVVIPWTTLGGEPAEGTFMGIDVQVDDNDGTTRSGKKAWADGSDNAWQSTAVLGALQVGGCPNPYKPSAVNLIPGDDSKINFYPNPFSDSGFLNLTGKEDISVTIMDVSGRQVWNKVLQGNSTYAIGEQLPPGMYLLELTNGSFKQTTKLIKL